jgi:hypothetical protein
VRGSHAPRADHQFAASLIQAPTAAATAAPATRFAALTSPASKSHNIHTAAAATIDDAAEVDETPRDSVMPFADCDARKPDAKLAQS